MPTYIEKTPLFKAVKIADILADTSATLASQPAWVKAELVSGRISKQVDITILSVVTPQGKRIAKNSDMLVKNLAGDLSIEDANRFLATHDKTSNNQELK